MQSNKLSQGSDSKKDQSQEGKISSSSSLKRSRLDIDVMNNASTSACNDAAGSHVSKRQDIGLAQCIDSAKSQEAEVHIVDIAQTLDIKPGARIEVQWDLHFDNHEDGNTETKNTRWWGGTLLQPDSRSKTLQEFDNQVKDEVIVPIRVIDYDPYAEGGFLERSLEDVCFLSDHSLLNVASDTRAYWRKEGDNWEPKFDMDEEEKALMAPTTTISGIPSGIASGSNNGNMSDDDISVASTSKEDALKTVLDTVLQSALQKTGILGKMNQMEASQQCFMAEKIAKAKEKLTETLMNSLGDVEGEVVTKEHVVKCVEEFKKDA